MTGIDAARYDEPLRTRWFFAGGTYVPAGDGTTMVGQCYVKRFVPPTRTAPWPIVLVHGGGASMLSLDQTPDGRPGWARYFAHEGFDTYLIDQSGRGRSPGFASVGHSEPHLAEEFEAQLTAIEQHGLWRTAARHSQYPEGAHRGDPTFDNHFASIGLVRHSPEERRISMDRSRDALGALLAQIGPSILLTHSQSGELGWLAVDAFPGLVKAVLAIEPSGPPFFDTAFGPAPEYQVDGRFTRPWGIARQPITYDPPVDDPATDLPFVRQAEPDAEGLVRCHLQAGEPRQLVNFSAVKVLVVNGEASHHAAYEHCNVMYLRQAGVDVTHMPLADRGIRGNGHDMIMERNNLEIAAAMHVWLVECGLA